MSNYPLIKFTFLFIVGILLESLFAIDSKTLITFFIILLAAVLFLHVINKPVHFIKSFLIFVTITILGASIFCIYNLHPTKYSFDQPKYKNAHVLGEVNRIELIRKERVSFRVLCDTLLTDHKKYVGRFNVIVSLYDSSNSLKMLYEKMKIGNRISAEVTFQKPRDKRNPFEFDYEKYLSERGIIALATCYDVSKMKIISDKINFTDNTIFEIRKYLDGVIYSLHNETTSAMLRGLLLADRSGIDAQINQDFINAGVVHVLSVSGLHVGYIVIIFLFLFNRLNPYWRIWLTITGLFVYMIITGSEAPVFRSTVMASIVLITPILGRESNSVNTLSLAALIILILNPLELFNPSFQLSFVAILSLIILFPVIKKYVDDKKINSRVLKYFIMFFSSTLAAQIGTLPFTLVYFGRISITSLLANLFVIPISGFIVGLGIVSIIAFHFSYWFANIFGACNELLTFVMLYLVKLFGNPKFSFVTINQFSIYDSILFYLSLGLCFSQMQKFTSKLSKIIFIILIFVTYFVYSRLDNYELLPQNKLSVLTIDVGQGEAILIKFPNGQTALIDSGDANERFDNGKRIIEPLLNKLGISKIDYGFVSHVDGDHYLGYVSLISDGMIKKIIKPALDPNEEKDKAFENFIKKMKLPIEFYHKSRMKIGNVFLYVLNNSANENGKISSNDRSGMLKLVYGNTSFLFTGDASISAEKNYISQYHNFLKADVLKAGHHGSRISSYQEFLRTVLPNYAIISAGIINRFKHPSNETLLRLSNIKASILRTDKLGAILLQSNSAEIKLIDWKSE